VSKPLVTIARAAEGLGLEGPHAAQWLRRYVLQRERELGKEILERVGSGRRRPTYRVNMVSLKRACPELFDSRDGFDRALRGLVGALGGRVDQVLEAVEEGNALAAANVEALRRFAELVRRR
jgi:hypothetical protein